MTLHDRLVLVTGATGFVGRHLVRTLAEETTAGLRLVTRAGGPDDLPAAARDSGTMQTMQRQSPMRSACLAA